MKSNTDKNKLKHINDTSNEIKNELSKKNSDNQVLPVSNYVFQSPKLLKDLNTQVIGTSFSWVGNYPNNYVFYDYRGNFTALQGQEVSSLLSYGFKTELEISEDSLSNVKCAVLVEPPQNARLVAYHKFEEYTWNTTTNFYEIKGDDKIIYKGQSPFYTIQNPISRISQSEIDNGDAPEDLLSKWYYGNINFSLGVDDYEYRNTYIVLIYGCKITGISHYDGETPFYNYEVFVCEAIDAMTNTSVTGIGTYTVVTWVENEGIWHAESVSTKNVTRTVSLFDEGTSISVYGGERWKNGSYLGTISTLTTLPYKDQSYDANFDISSIENSTIDKNNVVLNVGELDSSGVKTYRLWYDVTHSREFGFATTITKLLTNTPISQNYQSGTLPYTKLYVQMNLDTEDDVMALDGSEIIEYAYNTKGWGKLADNKYILQCKGVIPIVSKAVVASTRNKATIDEEYTGASGVYTRDAENRPNRTLTVYMPEEEITVNVRFIITLGNEILLNEIKKYSI